MKASFIETSGFTEWVAKNLPDDAYAALQRVLMENPTAGDVMPGCGGLRKIRTPDPKRGKGKRGGARVIYFYVPETQQFLMVDGYGKDEQDDLSARERKVLSRLADAFRAEAKAAAERRTGKRK